MDNPKISVIIPIYKVEKYIHKCIDSILLQTFTNFECILVDDCSPDKCPDICDEYSKKDNRVIVIHKNQNEGCPRARITGLDISKGDYILFADSDDYLDCNMLNKMYHNAISNNSDLLICRCVSIYNGISKIDNYPKIKNKIAIIKQIILYGQFSASVWDKLIKRDIYMKIKFPTNHYIDDRVITIQSIFYSENISYIDEGLYFYNKNDESICGSKSQDKKIFDEYNNFLIIESFYKNISSRSLKNIFYFLLRIFIYFIFIILRLLFIKYDYLVKNEDEVWSLLFNKEGNIPSALEAINFSFELYPTFLYNLNNNKLPFGCHAWYLYNNFLFYKDHIDNI